MKVLVRFNNCSDTSKTE